MGGAEHELPCEWVFVSLCVLMEQKPPSLVREVGPDEVFNLPLYEHHLVIDIRPAEEFSHGHMATAVSFPYLPLELESCNVRQVFSDM